MFARNLLGFSLACLLLASPVQATEGLETMPAAGIAQPEIVTDVPATPEPQPTIAADKLVPADRLPDETIATGSDTAASADSDS